MGTSVKRGYVLCLVLIGLSVLSELACSQDPHAATIQPLIKDLGSSVFAKRDAAFKQLRTTPGALTHLRSALKDQDLETRRRMEILIKEFSQLEFKRRLREMTDTKSEIRLDLLVDIVTENKHSLDMEEWKRIIESVRTVGDKASKAKGLRPKVTVFDPDPDPDADYYKHPPFLGTLFTFNRGFSERRIIADQVQCRDEFFRSVVILSTSLESGDCGGAMVLANGNVSLRSCFGSFIYCDGDCRCRLISNSIVIARGQIHADRIDYCSVVIQCAPKSSRVKLFSAEDVGWK